MKFNLELWKKAARYSYFFFALLSCIGAMIHLNIKFDDAKCKEKEISNKMTCVGRNLVWAKRGNGQLDDDYNAGYWRSTISLVPDVFVDTWAPVAFAILSVSQHLDGCLFSWISASWLRALGYIIFWHMFGLIGYSANWGVFCGLWGILQLGLLYLPLVVLGDEDELPVLQIDVRTLAFQYLGIGHPSTHSHSPQATGSGREPLVSGSDADQLRSQTSGSGPSKSGVSSSSGSSNDSYQSYQHGGYQSVPDGAVGPAGGANDDSLEPGTEQDRGETVSVVQDDAIPVREGDQF